MIYYVFNFLRSGSDWLRVTPFGMRRILAWIKKTYRNPDVYITENGVSDNHGSLKDKDRVHYFKYYINNVLQGISISIAVNLFTSIKKYWHI